MTHEEAQLLREKRRAEIDDVDKQLVELLNRRASLVMDVGRAKNVLRLPVYDPKREENVYRNVRDASSGPMTEAALTRIFERITDEMRSLQDTLNVEKNSAKAQKGDS